MFLKSTAALAAAIGLVAAPVAAAPSASKLSVSSSVRAGSPEGDEALNGGSGAIIAGLLVLGIIAIPVIDAIQDDNNDDLSVSP